MVVYWTDVTTIDVLVFLKEHYYLTTANVLD